MWAGQSFSRRMLPINLKYQNLTYLETQWNTMGLSMHKFHPRINKAKVGKKNTMKFSVESELNEFPKEKHCIMLSPHILLKLHLKANPIILFVAQNTHKIIHVACNDNVNWYNFIYFSPMNTMSSIRSLSTNPFFCFVVYFYQYRRVINNSYSRGR